MIEPRQIRAARALLNWNQSDLARASGIAVSSIKNIENDQTAARKETLDDIKRALESAGVEFVSGSGVRMKQTDIQVFEGPTRFSDFYDIVYGHLNQHGGEVCIGGSDATLYSKYRANPEQHRKRMADLVRKRPDIKVRILCQEGDINMVALSYAFYRWQSREFFSPTTFYTFGDYLALISFYSENPPQVILIRNAPYADAYRHTFNQAWRNAKVPPRKKAL